MRWIAELDVQITLALIAAWAGAAGWVLRTFHVKYLSERYRAIGDLLQNYTAISSIGMRRLEGEAREALRRWRDKSAPPAAGIKVLSLATDARILCRYVYDGGLETSCPEFFDKCGQPIWIKLQGQAQGDALGQLESAFADLAQTWPLSDKLLSTIEIPEDVVVWITAPHLKLRTRTDTTAFMDAVDRLVKTRLVAARSVLETPMNSRSLAALTGDGWLVLVPRWPEAASNSQHSPDAVRYAQVRDRAEAYLAAGAHFGSRSERNHYLVPGRIVEMLYRDEFKRLFDVPWSMLQISGPPGSCKTSFVATMAEYLRRSGIVTIDATRNVVKALSEDLQKARVDSILLALATAATEGPSVPPDFRADNVAIEALQDALFEMLRSGAGGAVVIFDELETAREARAILPQIYDLICERGIRLVVAGRTTIDVASSSDDRVLSITTRLVDRATAAEILRAWLGSGHAIAPDVLLRHGVFAEKTLFSTHLLRLAAENVEDVSATSSALLKRKLDLYVAPMSLRLGKEFFAGGDENASAARVLQRLKGQIMSGASAEALLKIIAEVDIQRRDLTEILGTLAWAGRFEQGDLTLDVEAIVKWSQRFALTAADARALLDAGVEAGIFRAGAPEWLDKMVADGFGALHLPQVMDGGERAAVIAEMVRTLHKTNSIDVLSLALDPHVLLRLISVALDGIGAQASEASAARSSALIEAIDKLITPEVLARLRGTDWADRIAQNVWASARGVPFPQLVPVCRVLEKLARVSSKVALLCEQYATIEDFEESARALGVRAIQHVDDRSHFSFTTVRSHRENAGRAAAHIWSVAGAAALLDEIASWTTPSAAHDVWRVWCQRQDLDTLRVLLDQMVAMCTSEDRAMKSLPQVLAATADAAVAPNPHAAARRGFADVGLIERLLTCGRNAEAGAIVPWIMHARLPDVISPKTTWYVDPTGKFLLPTQPAPSMPVRRIFALLRNDASVWLPLREELVACGVSGPEFVRDGFPPTFRGDESEAFPATSFQLLAPPGEAQFIDVGRITEAVAWRPCIVMADVARQTKPSTASVVRTPAERFERVS